MVRSDQVASLRTRFAGRTSVKRLDLSVGKKFDYVPLLLVLCLLVFGVVMVYDASSAMALQSFGDKYFFLKEQIRWVIFGLAAGGVAYFWDYRSLRSLALPGLVISLFLLIAVFLPGIGVRAYGAHRWINLGFTVLQPSELAKLTLVIYLSAWLTTEETGRLFSFLLLVGLLVGLIILEPDMGTAIILLGSAMSMYFLSESSFVGMILLTPLVLLGGVGLAVRSAYRLARVLTFFNPDADPLGASYHIRQILIALGSGGIFGLGLGNSRQKYSYLPEATTDSIFAVIGEELGLIGTTILIIVFGVFIYRSFKMSLLVEDKFGRLLSAGIVSWLGFQTVVNLASAVALVPLTGVPLPFVSYGGSALVVELIGIGILGSIWRQIK